MPQASTLPHLQATPPPICMSVEANPRQSNMKARHQPQPQQKIIYFFVDSEIFVTFAPRKARQRQ